MLLKASLVASAVLSLMLAVPLGGFVYGFQHCLDCGDSIGDRLFMGCITAVLTILGGGYPSWQNHPNHPRANAWPYIWVVAGLLFCVAIGLVRIATRRSSTQQR
ncbi:MAG TPA: hypothetical protein VJR89_09435 [Polyangiales bacterium]|nr:hypothetical protein [Polyangiales bacterium]